MPATVETSTKRTVKNMRRKGRSCIDLAKDEATDGSGPALPRFRRNARRATSRNYVFDGLKDGTMKNNLRRGNGKREKSREVQQQGHNEPTSSQRTTCTKKTLTDKPKNQDKDKDRQPIHVQVVSHDLREEKGEEKASKEELEFKEFTDDKFTELQELVDEDENSNDDEGTSDDGSCSSASCDSFSKSFDDVDWDVYNSQETSFIACPKQSANAFDPFHNTMTTTRGSFSDLMNAGEFSPVKVTDEERTVATVSTRHSHSTHASSIAFVRESPERHYSSPTRLKVPTVSTMFSPNSTSSKGPSVRRHASTQLLPSCSLQHTTKSTKNSNKLSSPKRSVRRRSTIDHLIGENDNDKIVFSSQTTKSPKTPGRTSTLGVTSTHSLDQLPFERKTSESTTATSKTRRRSTLNHFTGKDSDELLFLSSQVKSPKTPGRTKTLRVTSTHSLDPLSLERNTSTSTATCNKSRRRSTINNLISTTDDAYITKNTWRQASNHSPTTSAVRPQKTKADVKRTQRRSTMNQLPTLEDTQSSSLSSTRRQASLECLNPSKNSGAKSFISPTIQQPQRRASLNHVFVMQASDSSSIALPIDDEELSSTKSKTHGTPASVNLRRRASMNNALLSHENSLSSCFANNEEQATPELQSTKRSKSFDGNGQKEKYIADSREQHKWQSSSRSLNLQEVFGDASETDHNMVDEPVILNVRRRPSLNKALFSHEKTTPVQRKPQRRKSFNASLLHGSSLSISLANAGERAAVEQRRTQRRKSFNCSLLMENNNATNKEEDAASGSIGFSDKDLCPRRPQRSTTHHQASLEYLIPSKTSGPQLFTPPKIQKSQRRASLNHVYVLQTSDSSSIALGMDDNEGPNSMDRRSGPPTRSKSAEGQKLSSSRKSKAKDQPEKVNRRRRASMNNAFLSHENSLSRSLSNFEESAAPERQSPQRRKPHQCRKLKNHGNEDDIAASDKQHKMESSSMAFNLEEVLGNASGTDAMFDAYLKKSIGRLLESKMTTKRNSKERT